VERGSRDYQKGGGVSTNRDSQDGPRGGKGR